MNIILFLLLVALNLADIYYTRKILAAGGRELNPLVRWLMEKFGVMGGMVLVKIPALVVAAFLPWWMLLALCLFYGVVVGSNAEVYYDMRDKNNDGF